MSLFNEVTYKWFSSRSMSLVALGLVLITIPNYWQFRVSGTFDLNSYMLFVGSMVTLGVANSKTNQYLKKKHDQNGPNIHRGHFFSTLYQVITIWLESRSMSLILWGVLLTTCPFYIFVFQTPPNFDQLGNYTLFVGGMVSLGITNSKGKMLIDSKYSKYVPETKDKPAE